MSMSRRWAYLRCGCWFNLGRLCNSVGVSAIPNAVWWLQIPGANGYQFCMERSIRLEDAWNLGYWGKPVPIDE